MPLGRPRSFAMRAAVLLVVSLTAYTTVVPAAAEVVAVDTGGPEVRDVTFDPPAVDVSTAPAVVAVSARVTDAQHDVGSVRLRLGDADPVALGFTSGRLSDGIWSGVATVPAYTAHGEVPVRVEAIDVAGAATSAGAPGALAVADAVPAAPASIRAAAAGPDSVEISWTPPVPNGGSPVSAYDVSAAPAPGSSEGAVTPPAATADAATVSVTLHGLSTGTRYVVRVAARNAVGAGPAAQADTVPGAVSPTVPDAPTTVVVTPGDGALRVRWTAPVSDGGQPVTGYVVRAVPRSSGPAVAVGADPTATAAEVGGLGNGVAHDVEVTAVNAIGASLAGTAAGTPRTVPGTPSVTGVTAGEASAIVRWDPPASDGGAPVTSYVVTAAPGGATITTSAAARSAIVSGLENGVATTFTVVAVNAAGVGAPSASSVAVVPRRAGRLAVTARPRSPITHGMVTAVGASLTSLAGTALPGQAVELHAQVRPGSSWRQVAAGTTDAAGRVTLRATLPATSLLRLRHPVGAVNAPDVLAGTVAVAPRVAVTARASRTRVGVSSAVRGTISPPHRAGTPVVVQQRVAAGWRTVATGRLTSTTAFAASWRPQSVGTQSLRVVLPAHPDHLAGASPRWETAVLGETVADVARQILANPRVSLYSSHVSGVHDHANARQNVVDLAAGRRAFRSAYENAPGGTTTVDLRVLRALRRMGQLGSISVTEIAGGSHARRSRHYSGLGIDVNRVNGRPVGGGASYGWVVSVCRHFGASRVFHPTYDPYGGHKGHIHCEW